MIRKEELQELRPQIRCKGDENATLQAIQKELEGNAQRYEIPVSFRYDKIRSGLLGGSDECLVIFHPKHLKDYFSIAVQIKHQGNFAFVSINSFGTSKLMKAEAVRKQILATAKEGFDRAADIHKDYNVLNDAVYGAAFASTAFVGMRHLIKGKSDKEKIEHEQQWYAVICDMLDEIISK